MHKKKGPFLHPSPWHINLTSKEINTWNLSPSHSLQSPPPPTHTLWPQNAHTLTFLICCILNQPATQPQTITKDLHTTTGTPQGQIHVDKVHSPDAWCHSGSDRWQGRPGWASCRRWWLGLTTSSWPAPGSGWNRRAAPIEWSKFQPPLKQREKSMEALRKCTIWSTVTVYRAGRPINSRLGNLKQIVFKVWHSHIAAGLSQISGNRTIAWIWHLAQM